MREPTLYKLLIFHNLNLISIFHPLGCLSKESVQVRGSLRMFVTNLFSRWRVVSPTPYPQPLVVCPLLLIQYIRSYPPQLKAIPNINTKQNITVLILGSHCSDYDDYILLSGNAIWFGEIQLFEGAFRLHFQDWRVSQTRKQQKWFWLTLHPWRRWHVISKHLAVPLLHGNTSHKILCSEESLLISLRI
jgi:hypothetical protein